MSGKKKGGLLGAILGAVLAPVTGGASLLAGAAAGATLGTTLIDAPKAAKEQQKAASKAQEKAASQAAQVAKDQADKADQDFNRANQKRPNAGVMQAANTQAALAGGQSTMLTGPSGVDPTALPLGRNTLLGQ